MPRRQELRLLVAHPDADAVASLAPAFERWGISVYRVADQSQALARILETPPDAVIVERHSPPGDALKFCHLLKRDQATAHVPVLVRMDREELVAAAARDDLPIDDFFLDWGDGESLALRVRLAVGNASRELDANPLTRLGGNNAIMRTLEEWLAEGRDFGAGYVDIDNFKAFNDRYGFARGDEVIRMTARLLTTSVQASDVARRSLIGHVGGDDFVYLVPCEAAVRVGEELIERFELMVRTLYDEDDERRGGIRAINRRGELEFFPMMTLSVAVAMSHRGSIDHPGKLSAVIGELKATAKSTEGSEVVVDRRHDGGYFDRPEMRPSRRLGE